MYMRGMEIQVRPGAEILADSALSYFDRDYLHFCSHRQTPSSGLISHPAIVQNDKVIYFSHPLFSQYQTKAPLWCKKLLGNALDRLLPNPIVQVTGPSSIIATLNRQTQLNRYVLHLMFYIPERRCEDYDVIEDVVPLYDVPVCLNLPIDIQKVTIVPEGRNIQFTNEGTHVRFNLPQITGHCMVEIS